MGFFRNHHSRMGFICQSAWEKWASFVTIILGWASFRLLVCTEIKTLIRLHATITGGGPHRGLVIRGKSRQVGRTVVDLNCHDRNDTE